MEDLKRVQSVKMEYKNRILKQDNLVESHSPHMDGDLEFLLGTFKALLFALSWDAETISRLVVLSRDEAIQLYGEDYEDFLT